MKKSVRAFSFVLSLVLLFGSLALTPFAAGKAEPELKFGEDGTFRIMHITDTHYTDFPFEEAITFIGNALDDYKPDLVIFGGDNIKGWFDTSMQLGVRAAIDQLVAPLEERGIPFSYVYGNHDHQTYLCPKQLQNKYYAKHDNCISPNGYSSLSRTGIGNILIKDSSGQKDIFNIWLFDSGTIREASSTVEAVNKAQLDWYNKTCGKLTEANGGKAIPAIAFQHFAVEEVTQLFDAAETGVSVGGQKYTLKDGFSDSVYNGRFGDENSRIATHLNKSVEISTENSGEYSEWVKNGDVKAAFFGHSHVNDYCGKTSDGIILAATMSAGGFNIASRFDAPDGSKVEARGVRIIDIDENILKDSERDSADAISSFSVYYSDYDKGSVEKYPSKYKAYDEHSFSEWIEIELGYFKKYILGIK